MKIVPTILFTVLLTSLVYFTSSQPNQREKKKFNHFLFRLEKALNSTGDGFLPFELTVGVIENLRWTSDEFKKLCLVYDAEHKEEDGFLSPISGLNRTINHLFYYYKKSAKKIVMKLKEIERVDPIGFNVYLTKKNVENSSPIFMDFVEKFRKTMKDRVALFKMKTDDSYFSIIDRKDYENLQRLPKNIRNRIAIEYSDTPDVAVDMFTDLVTDLTSNKMYRMRTNDLDVYQEHNSSTTDDVQIIYGTYFHNTNYWAEVLVTYHAICINYKASTQKVHVYDSLMDRRLDGRQQDIIGKLYPNNLGVVFERPMSLQDHHPTCGIFAITYATMLLLKRDPAETNIKLNKVHGDETLYMRKHILNMLATRKLSLIKCWQINE